jgi:hypothetical protein
MTLRIDPLSLANVCDGEIERAFQEQILPELATIFATQDPIPWELGKGSTAQAKVKIELTFEHSFDTGITAVLGGVDIKPPKRRKIARPVMIREGGVFVEPGGEQLSLYTHTPKEA